MGIKVGASEVGVYVGAEKIAGLGGKLQKTYKEFSETITSGSAQNFTVDTNDSSLTLDNIAISEVKYAWAGSSTASTSITVDTHIISVNNGVVTLSGQFSFGTPNQRVTISGNIAITKVE